MSRSPRAPGTGSSRVTPWQLIFGAPAFDESRFDQIREQTGGAEVATASELVMTPAAGELLRELAPAGGGREGLAHASALLYGAYRFRLHGRHVYRIGDAQLRALISQQPVPAPPVPPAPAGYVQLPRHVVWARVSEEAVPEPVDGFFWSTPSAPAGVAGRLDLLFALGVRAGRPGVTLFDVALESLAQLADWAGVAARPEGEDFANVLPGGELQGYHAITTAGEALKLAALCFACIADPARDWDVVVEGSESVHSMADG